MTDTLIKAVGGRYVMIDQDDVTNQAGIARWLGTGRSTVAMWITRQESNGFPEPVITTLDGIRLWSKKEVGAWLDAK